MGSAEQGGRWNPPGSHPTVYLSLSTDTAYLEWKSWWRRFGMRPEAALPRVFAAVEVEVLEVLDLSDGDIRQRLRVSADRMISEDWESANDSGAEALTQAIGRAAYAQKFEGLVVPSARSRDGHNLVLFVDNLLPQSVMREQGVRE